MKKSFKINCFKPSLKFYNYSKMQDFFDFRIFMCNFIGFTLGIWGYTMQFRITWYNPAKKLREKPCSSKQQKP